MRLTSTKTIRAWCVGVACALGLALPACKHYLPSEPSDVAQGRYYSSGRPDYDELFLAVYRLQVGLKDGPDALARVESSLKTELKLGADAEPPALRLALNERTHALQGRGVSLRLERDVGGRTKLASSGDAGSDAEFVRSFGEAIDVTSEIRSNVGGWQREIDRLPARAIELEQGVDAAFRLDSFGKAGEVRENLADAQKVMGLLRPILKDLDSESAEFLEVVTGALRTTTAPPEPEPAPEAEPEPAKPRPKGAPRRSHSAPAPRAKSPPPDDAPPPPPKPATGPAKPDFEP